MSDHLVNRLYQAADRVRRWTSDRPLWLVLINSAGESMGESLIPAKGRTTYDPTWLNYNDLVTVECTACSTLPAILGYRVEDRASQDRVMATVYFDLPVVQKDGGKVAVFVSQLDALDDKDYGATS